MARIEIDKKEDREALALILVKNGYTVKITKGKPQGGSKAVYFVEYEK